MVLPHPLLRRDITEDVILLLIVSARAVATSSRSRGFLWQRQKAGGQEMSARMLSSTTILRCDVSECTVRTAEFFLGASVEPREEKHLSTAFLSSRCTCNQCSRTDLGAVTSFHYAIFAVTNDDAPQVTAGSSRTPDYQLDRSEEDWSGLCRQATGATTSGTGSSASGLDDHSGTSPSAQNYAARMRSTALTTGAAGRKIATAATSTN